MNAYQRDHSFYARSHGGSASKFHAMGDDLRSKCGRVRMLNPDEPKRISDVPAILRCKVCWPHGSVDTLNNQPWPLRDVVRKLCEAAEILLHEKNYDSHGHEEISQALKVGREWSSPPNKRQPCCGRYDDECDCPTEYSRKC